MGSGRRGKKGGGRFPLGVGWALMLGSLVVFSAVVAVVTYSARNEIRSQMLDVDSHVLNMLVQREIEKAERQAGVMETFEALSGEEIWQALQETATLRGVLAVRYFDSEGRLIGGGGLAGERVIPGEIAEQLELAGTVSAFWGSSRPAGLAEMEVPEGGDGSVSEIYLSLSGFDGVEDYGTACYLMDAKALARQFSLLDQHLRRQAGLAIGIGAVVIFAIVGFTRRRLSEADARVDRHLSRLNKANAELETLARTSAVGSVAAHLMHSLKNPLAGLREVMSAGRSGKGKLDEEEWREASEAADRMQRMVEEVTAVLRDAETGLSYETSSGDLLDALESRFGRTAATLGLAFSVWGEREAALENRVSSIATLVVSNLIQNAFDSTPRGGWVKVSFSSSGTEAVVRVEDSGPGVAEALRGKLFSPVSSGKKGGAGIGLTISSQLARHLGGSLSLAEAAAGAAFELRFPTLGVDVGS